MRSIGRRATASARRDSLAAGVQIVELIDQKHQIGHLARWETGGNRLRGRRKARTPSRYAHGVAPRGSVTMLTLDVYELSVDLAPGVRDLVFVEALDRYLTALRADGRIERWRLLRSKLGLGARSEFKVLIETRDLAQLDAAFAVVSARAHPIEEFHEGVNSLVTNFQAALWRDFPDPQRVTGQERF